MSQENKEFSRRKFLTTISITAVGLPLVSSFMGLEDLVNPSKKLGIALVGLGTYSRDQLGPALLQTKHCYLAGIVTGTPSKIPVWKEKYNLKDSNIYNYENFDKIVNNPDIDIVYVVLPNSMHAEYSIRAAQAGKHVICEKPMAISVAECDAMIAASKKAGKSLSIGYRLHYDPYHNALVEMGAKKKYGEIKKISTAFSFETPKSNYWRIEKKYAGGGPLMDLGVYCLQAVIYTTGMLPVAVTAKAPTPRHPEVFVDVEESIIWQMEMPNGAVAECKSSYSGAFENYFKVEAEKGWMDFKPAFNYGGNRANTSDGPLSFPNQSQQASQMDGIALSINSNRPSIVPGEMGRRDMVIIEAIYAAMKSGQRVSLKW